MFRSLILLSLIIFLSGCIVTRGQLAQQQQEQSKINQIQAERAGMQTQVDELQADLRDAMGRIEQLESEKRKVEEANAAEQANVEAEEKDRIKAYEESITQLQEQVATLSGELKAVKNVLLAKKAVTKTDTQRPVIKGPYTRGEANFKNKDWQKAIPAYQEYRERFKNGRLYKDATYKIGVCFQELGMLSEAKVFYDELIDRWPKSKEAAKAKTRLKKIR